MSSVVLHGSGSVWRDEFDRAVIAVRCIGWRHYAIALGVGFVLVAINLPVLIENVQKHGLHLGALTSSMLAPPLCALILMVSGVIAAAVRDSAIRVRRLAIALFAGSLVSTAAVVSIWVASGAIEHSQQIAAARGKPPIPLPLMFVTDLLSTMIVGALAYAVFEVLHRRSNTQRAFQELARRQASIAQQVLESRLAAMQAQVEPRFLFDSLVDIEALYAKDVPAAADLLDRLISYLRAALPKLREQGSTIGAEIELLQAYLGVVNALNDGRPRLIVTLAEDCRNVRFYPMLLLPLVQRAVRGAAAMPESMRLGVSRAGNDIAIVLRIAAAGGCADDAELARVRERLTGLYGKTATLDCNEPGQQTTQFTLRFAANSPTAVRRA